MAEPRTPTPGSGTVITVLVVLAYLGVFVLADPGCTADWGLDSPEVRYEQEHRPRIGG